MAVIDFTRIKNLVDSDITTWAAVTGSDTGAPREYAKFNDKTV